MPRKLIDPRTEGVPIVKSNIIGQADGVASLNEIGIVPESQLPDFLTEAEGDVKYAPIGAVDSVNGQTGVVVLDAVDVGAEVAGVMDEHLASVNPHSQYILKTAVIRQPTAISPTTGTIDYGVDGTLTANSYGHLYDTTRLHREYQIDILSGDFSAPIRSVEIDSDDWVITPPIPDDTEFQWRCRDVSTESEVGPWSEVQTFKTLDIYIQTPTITYPLEGGVLSSGNIATSSPYVGVNLSHGHIASYWIIRKQDQSIAYQTGRDTVNLTSLTIPNGVIVIDTTMSIEVRYESSNGMLSDWSAAVIFTGVGVPFGKYLVVAHNTTPHVTIYGQDVDEFIKLDNPATLPTGNGYGVSWSSDGTYLAIAHSATPYISIYKRSGDAFTKLANPATPPTGVGYGVSWSSDGTYLAIAHTSTPFITIYKRSGDVFTKLANPTTLPTSVGRGVSWSSDSTYLAVAHQNTPFITIYKRSGDVFTKLANPATLPTGTGYSTSWSSDDVYLAVAHATTPFITIYKRSGDVFAKLANPATLPTGVGLGVSWSSDGTYLAIAHLNTPFITIYKRSGDVFAKLADPATLPADTGYSVSWSSDGTYLAIVHLNTPFITIYKRSGDTFAKLADPATLPADTGLGVSFYG